MKKINLSFLFIFLILGILFSFPTFAETKDDQVLENIANEDISGAIRDFMDNPPELIVEMPEEPAEKVSIKELITGILSDVMNFILTIIKESSFTLILLGISLTALFIYRFKKTGSIFERKRITGDTQHGNTKSKN